MLEEYRDNEHFTGRSVTVEKSRDESTTERARYMFYKNVE
jgi:hypothetical protein